jgi:hypothetical protein
VRAVCRPTSILGKVLAVLCVCAAMGYGVLYAISPWLLAQRVRQFNPRASLVPVALTTKAEAPLSDVNVDVGGFRIQLPKELVERPVSRSRFAIIRLRNGGLMVEAPGSRETGIDRKAVERLVGPDLARPGFKSMEAALRTTPDRVKLWRLRSAENEQAAYLLVMKISILMSRGWGMSGQLTPIQSISAGEVRGFEIGNPDAPPYEAKLDLFDGMDRHLTVDVVGESGHGLVLTQAEVNAMVAGIRAVQGGE